MFDEKNHDRNDALGQRLQKIGGQMNPSPELKKAAKTGVPLRAGGIRYTAGTHVRKFTKAVLLYAACIALFLGAILLIPRWFGGNEPVGSDPDKTSVSDPTTTVPPTNDENPTEEMRSPETVYNMLFTEKNVTWSMEIHTEDGGSIDGSISWARKNNLLKKSGGGLGEVPTDVYYDGDRYWSYEYDTEKEAWFKYYQKLDVDQIWTEQCKGYLDERYFKDLYYYETDGCYKATETGLSYMMGADVSAYYDQIVCDFTLQDGVYTFRFVLDMEEPNISHSVIIRIGFGNAVFKLPEAEIYVCEHEYVDGICTVCGKSEEVAPETEECEHEYANGVCTICGERHTHEYEEVTSDEQLCLYGLITVRTCKYCDDSYTHQTPAPGHDYQNGTCTRCGTVKAESPVIDPNVTAGSQSLLPYQMYQIYPEVSADRFTALHPDSAPYYYNIYTYFGGYTVTDIRLPVLSAKKGDTLTVSVIQTTNGFNEETPLATYKLTATRAISGEWVLFSGLSIEVPEGYTLIFGAMGDTLCVSDITEAADPLPDYFYCNDYRGLCGEQMLILDVYGFKGSAQTLELMKEKGCPDNLLPTTLRSLTAQELASAKSFLNGDTRWILTERTFFRPEDIRVEFMFYMRRGTDHPSDAEQEQLDELRGEVFIPGDCNKMTKAQLDAYLMQYMDIHITPDMRGPSIYYLEEFDSYYMFATDHLDIGVTNPIGWLTEDGNYLVRSSGYMDDFTVLLKPTANGFLIQQVVWIRDSIHWEP